MLLLRFVKVLESSPSDSQGAQYGRGSPGYRLAFVEQVRRLSATGAAGEPRNNDTSFDQMSSRGFGFKMHGC